MCSLVKFLFKLSVFDLWSMMIKVSPDVQVVVENAIKRSTYSTPPGCNAVLLTLLATMVTAPFKEVE